ncbi:MAG: YbaB/EbfC family nucleoid-associated protein [Armatimonadota bacterium]
MKKKILKNMQKKMQDTITQMQDDLGSEIVEGVAGDGSVKVTVNGKQELLSIKIDPEIVSKDEVDILEDLIMVAINDGMKKSQELGMEKMSQLTGGLNIPGLF